MSTTLREWYKENRIQVFIFGLVVFAHLFVFGLLVGYGVDVPVLGSDARGYARIAENVLYNQSFSPDVTGPFTPDSKRTPGYTLFLALSLFFFGSFISVGVVQSIVSGFSSLIIFRMSRKYFSLKGSTIVALLFGLNPVSLFLSSVLLSETIFTFLFLLSVYVFVRSGFRSVWAAFFLGLATLVRPIGQVLLVGFLVPLFHKWKLAILFILVVVLVLSPWVIRNGIHFGSPQLSLISTINMFSYHTAQFKAYQEGVSHTEALERLKKDLPVPYDEIDISTAHHLSRVVKDEFIAHPVSFGFFYVVKTIPFFLADGAGDVAFKVGLTEVESINITSLLLTRGARGFVSEMASQGVWALLSFLETLFWVIMCLCMCVSLWYARVISRFRVDIIYFATLIFLAALATGTVANARLRFPFEPFMLILAGLGLQYIRLWWRRKHL